MKKEILRIYINSGKKYDSYDICKTCGKTYGEHIYNGDYCPVITSHKKSKFRLKNKHK